MTINVEISALHNINVLCIEVYKVTEVLKEHFKMHLLTQLNQPYLSQP